jgi:hypothetical protein
MGIDRVGLPYLVSVSRFGPFGAGIINGGYPNINRCQQRLSKRVLKIHPAIKLRSSYDITTNDVCA